MKRIIALTIICTAALLGCGKKSIQQAKIETQDSSAITENSIYVEDSSITEESVLEESISLSANHVDFSFEWEELKDVMPADDYNDLCRFYPVLKNNNDICMYYSSDSEITNLEELTKDYFEDDNYEDFELWSIALVDMDGKYGKDLILEVSGYNYIQGIEDESILPAFYYVISEIDGSYYGYCLLGERCFRDLQNDGKYMGTGGAAYWYYHKVDMSTTSCKQYDIAGTGDIRHDDGTHTFYFYINDENGNEKQRWEHQPGEEDIEHMKWHNENYNDPAMWYHLPYYDNQGIIETYLPEPHIFNIDEN